MSSDDQRLGTKIIVPMHLEQFPLHEDIPPERVVDLVELVGQVRRAVEHRDDRVLDGFKFRITYVKNPQNFCV